MSGQDVMPLPPDTRTATDDLAEELKTVGQRISNTEIASDTQKVVDGWSGQTAAAHIREVRALGQKARELAEKLPEMEAALTPWSEAVGTSITTTVPALWTRYDDAQDAYTQSYNELKDEIDLMRRVGEPLTQAEIDAKHGVIIETRDSTQQTVLDDYKKAMGTLDEAAATAARALQGVMDSIVPPEAAEGGRAAVGAALFDDMPTVDGVAEWNYAQEQAPAAARELERLAQGATGEEIQAFYDKYGELMGDPFFARALAEEVGPEAMVEYSMWMETYVTQADPALQETVDKTRAALGEAIVLATGGHTADPAMADKEAAFRAAEDGLRTNDGQTIAESASDFIDEFKTIGRTQYYGGEPVTDPYLADAATDGYEYLSELLVAAGHADQNIALGTQFLEEAAPDFLAWDNETLIYRQNGMPVSQFGPMNADPVGALTRLMDAPANIGSAPAALQEEERLRMNGVRSFLDSDTSFDTDRDTDGDQRMNMTRYLTGHRYGGLYTGTDDFGDGLGRVLAQASLTEEPPNADPNSAEFREWSESDAQRTRIAANFLQGYQDGLDYDGADNLYRGEDQFGSTNSELRSWAGVILADHIEGIASSLNNPTGTGISTVSQSLAAGGEAAITFGPEFKDRLLDPKTGLFIDLAFDDPLIDDGGTPDDPRDDKYLMGRAPALQNLQLAAQNEYANDLQATLQSGATDLTAVNHKWATVLETMSTAPGGATEQAGAALDAHNETMKTLIGEGVSLLPLGDLVKDNGFGKFLLDQAKSHGQPLLLDALFPTDNAAAGVAQQVEEHGAVEVQMRHAMYQAISTHGNWEGANVLSPEEYWEGQSATDNPGYFLRPVADGSGALEVIPYDEMTREQRAAFSEYLAPATTRVDARPYEGDLRELDSTINSAKEERVEQK